MKLIISAAIQYEVEGAIEDARSASAKGATNDPSNAVYLKISAAVEARKGVGPVAIEADPADIAELKSRAEHEIGPCGVCTENISSCYEFSERSYWLGRKRAYAALLKQIEKAKQAA